MTLSAEGILMSTTDSRPAMMRSFIFFRGVNSPRFANSSSGHPQGLWDFAKKKTSRRSIFAAKNRCIISEKPDFFYVHFEAQSSDVTHLRKGEKRVRFAIWLTCCANFSDDVMEFYIYDEMKCLYDYLFSTSLKSYNINSKKK